MNPNITKHLTEREIALIKYALDVHSTWCAYSHLDWSSHTNLALVLDIAYIYLGINSRYYPGV